MKTKIKNFHNVRFIGRGAFKEFIVECYRAYPVIIQLAYKNNLQEGEELEYRR